jgi:hypothetical protein
MPCHVADHKSMQGETSKATEKRIQSSMSYWRKIIKQMNNNGIKIAGQRGLINRTATLYYLKYLDFYKIKLQYM